PATGTIRLAPSNDRRASPPSGGVFVLPPGRHGQSPPAREERSMSKNTRRAAYEQRRLERMWLLPADATPLERVLAYEPACFEGGRQQNYRIAVLCRELGLRPPWSLHLPEAKWPQEWQ